MDGRDRRVREWIVRSLRAAGWAPASVFAVHAFAFYGGAYGVFPPFDIPMHVAGGIVIAFFLARTYALAVEAGLLGRPSRLALALLVLTSTCAATVFWEFAEWTADRLFLTGEQGGLDDTLLDMALGIAGGSFFLLADGLLARVRAGGATA